MYIDVHKGSLYIDIYTYKGSFSLNIYVCIYMYVFNMHTHVSVSNVYFFWALFFFLISLHKLSDLHNCSVFSFFDIYTLSVTLQELQNFKSLIN